MIGVGLDFGTSNSTIAWFDGTQLNFVQVEADGPILPTALHLSRDFVGITGSAAIGQYVRENSARLVHMVPEIIGHAAGSIADASTASAMSELETARDAILGPLIDHGLPGRLFVGLKRLLGNPAINRLSVFNRPYRLVALLTPILLRLHDSLESAISERVGHVHVGRPINFEGRDSSRNHVATQRLTEACAHAGFRSIEFYPEPVAATLSFLRQHRSLASGTVLTVDFGGGTLDLSVLRFQGQRFDVLTTIGASLGGDRIDQLIFRRVLFPLLGEGEVIDRVVNGRQVRTQFPFHEYEEALLNWAISHTLNQNRYKTMLTELIALGGAAAVKFERLKDLINYNYSYVVFTAIKKAKAQLSFAEEATIDIPELNLEVSITRTQFDAMLADIIATLDALVQQTLQQAHLTAQQVTWVVRTGGSSQIAAVRRLLEDLFPGKVTEHDPFTSVAGGLAIANYRSFHFDER